MAVKKKKVRKKNVRHRARTVLFEGPIGKMSDEALAHATQDALVRWANEMLTNASGPRSIFLGGVLTSHVQEMISRFRPKRGPAKGTPNTGATKRVRGRFVK